MTIKLRVEEFEERVVPAIAIDSAYETYAWVFINTLRQNPTAFANNLDGLRTGTVNSAFGFSKTDPVITDFKAMISHAGVPAHYGQALTLMRSTAAAGPLAWDELLENRAGLHNDWMRANGFAHTADNVSPRNAIPGYGQNISAPADTWGYSGQFSWYGENIGYAIVSLAATEAANIAGTITAGGLQQRAAFLDTVAYMLELNSGSLGHLENLLGRDSGSNVSLPSFNAIGLDTDLFEAPDEYKLRNGVIESYLSTHRLGLYRPGNSGGFIAGIAFEDRNGNSYYDDGEGSAVTIDVRNSTGGGFTDTLTASNYGAFSGYVANGTYTVTISTGGVVLDSKSVSVNNSNAWAGFSLTGLGRPTLTSPTGSQTSLRPTVSWNTIADATNYQVRVDNLTTGATNLFNFAETANTSWSPTADLVSGQSYRVWVRAVEGSIVGAWSDFKDFSVSVPSRTGPVGVVADLRPAFTWSAITGATYQIRIDDVTGARNNIFPGVSVTGTSWNPAADLISGRNYRWQVRAMNAAGVGVWSPFTNFSVGKPVQTAPLGPVPNLRPTFTWTPVAGATAYGIIVNDVTAGRTNIFPNTRVTTTTWTPAVDLISGRNYSWQVVAVNALGYGAWTTASAFGAARPILSAPIGNVSDRTPTLTWSSITGATSYEVWIINRATGATVSRQFVSSTNWTLASDLAIGSYRWNVRAVNSAGLGNWSVYKEFQIV